MISVTAKNEDITREDAAYLPRKRYWVLPGMQLRMILWGVAVVSLVATVAAWTVLLVVWPPLASKFVLASSGPSVEDLFRATCTRVFLTTGMLIILFAVIACVTGLIVSHRIAGPLYRIRQIARQIADGRLGQRAAARKHDYVNGLVDDFNGMLDFFEGRLRRQQSAFDKLETRLDEMERLTAEHEAAPEKVDTCLRQARNVLRDVRLKELSEAEG